MSRVLVTNDDGAQSPLLHAFLSELTSSPWCSEVRAVIPKDEQSWVAQSVTRFRQLQVVQQPIGAVNGYVVDGSPADCASLGITELYPERPQLLISGINFGTNETLAFYLNSGTVGGARQGIVFGVRAIAVSLKLPRDLFEKWRNFDLEAIHAKAEDWKRASTVACNVVSRLLDDECWNGVDLYTINMPWSATEDTPVRITQLARVTYPSIFHSFQNGMFRHRLESLQKVENHGFGVAGVLNDADVIDQGLISLSPIAYDLFPRSESLKSALQSRFP